MPLYTFQCPACSGTRDVVVPIDQRNHAHVVCGCGAAMVRHQIYRQMVKADLPGYTCPITGQWIEGRRQHEENLKRHGCRVLESGETDAVRRNRAQAEAALERSVAETVEAEIHAMTPRQRELLASDLQTQSADIIRTTPEGA